MKLEEEIEFERANFWSFKKSMASGIVFLAPIFLTLLIVSWVLSFMSLIPGTGFLELTNYYYPNQIIKLVVIVGGVLLLSTLTGLVLRTDRGSQIENLVDSFVDAIPLLSTVYNTAKKTADTVFGKRDMGAPVKVDLGNMEITGFKTGNGDGDGKSLVFVPTSPNITSGFLVEIEDKWIEESGETRSQALSRVVSAGFGAGFSHEQNRVKNKTL